MPVKMSRHALAAMDDAALIWMCVEPVIAKIRGKNFAVKTETYENLSADQQALMMFQVLRGHSSSGVMEFYRLIPYLPSRDGVWRELQKAMRYFEDDAFAQLLAGIEGDYRAVKAASAAGGMEDFADAVEKLGEDSELVASIRRHDRLFHEAMPGAEKRVAAKIRSSWAEFLELRAE